MGYEDEEIGAVRMIQQHHGMDPIENQAMGNDTEQTHEDMDDDTEIVDFRNNGTNHVSS